MGLGGFQETEQLPIFSKITKFQGACEQSGPHGRDYGSLLRPGHARTGADPTQHSRAIISMANMITKSPSQSQIERGPGGRRKPRRSGRVPGQRFKFPVIVSGGGVINSNGVDECRRTGRAARSARRQSLSAQRLLPGEPSSVVRAARLSGIEGGDEAHLEGRCRSGARHAAWAFRHACRSTVSTTGRKTRKSSRSTPTTACSVSCKQISVRHCRRRKGAAEGVVLSTCQSQTEGAARMPRAAGSDLGRKRLRGRRNLGRMDA